MFKKLSLFILSGAVIAVNAPAQPITVTIDAGQIRAPISQYLYGQFIEQLGNVINRGIWAEMLDDRKFYYPVTTEPPSGFPTRSRFRSNRWTPIGPDDSVLMDTNHPCTGEHTPLILVDGAVPRGIQQAGLAVVRGKSYSGHVLLAGDRGAKVAVTLIWGTNAADRQTVMLRGVRAAYAKFPVKFTAGADSDDARLEITGTSRGAFHIGAVSLMPADNIEGFRGDVIAALKQLHSGVYRFPGGNFVSNFDWRDAIGDRDKRPPRWDYAWNAVQPNDVGLDEFMVLCHLLDVEPYITVNAGLGDDQSAADLVEYANGAPTTPMGRLRAKNGHPQPYDIKLWGIGNEMYGDWQIGYTSLRWYEIKHNFFAQAMRQVDPTIQLIASGAMPDEMTVTLQAKRITGEVLCENGSPADWTSGLLAHCLDNLDWVSEHAYCTSGQLFDFEQGKYVDVTNESLVEWSRGLANRVQAKYENYEDYLKRIPGLRQKQVSISLDEWAYRGIARDSYKPALAYAWMFDELFRHTEIFKMAAFTFATSCLSEDRNKAELNPVGLMFKLYRDHFGTMPVEVAGNSPQPLPRYPVGGDQPKVNAGSDTYPLDVVAAWSSDRKTLTVAVVNPTESERQLAISFKGVELTGTGKLWRMAPSSVDATNRIGQEPQVKIEEHPLDTVPDALTIAPISVNIYEFAAR
jgi:alpha-L-arabinofuranosidase